MQVASSFKVDDAILDELGRVFRTRTRAATLIRVIAIAETMVGHTDTNGVLTFVLPNGTLDRYRLRN